MKSSIYTFSVLAAILMLTITATSINDLPAFGQGCNCSHSSGNHVTGFGHGGGGGHEHGGHGGFHHGGHGGFHHHHGGHGHWWHHGSEWSHHGGHWWHHHHGQWIIDDSDDGDNGGDGGNGGNGGTVIVVPPNSSPQYTLGFQAGVAACQSAQ